MPLRRGSGQRKPEAFIPLQCKCAKSGMLSLCCVSECSIHLPGPQVSLPLVMHRLGTSHPLVRDFDHPELNLQQPALQLHTQLPALNVSNICTVSAS